MRNEWLNNLKVGDTVLVVDSTLIVNAEGAKRWLETITEVGTRIIVKSGRFFDRQSGYVPGGADMRIDPKEKTKGHRLFSLDFSSGFPRLSANSELCI